MQLNSVDILAAQPEPGVLPGWEAEHLPRLKPELQQRYAELGTPRRRLEWLTARVLLLEGLARIRGVHDPALDIAPSGLPLIDAGYHCAISHSRGLILAAISPSPVGMDVEFLQRKRPLRALERHFEPAERAAFAHPQDSASGIRERIRAWTFKEAVAKTVGMTIWDALPSVHWVPAGGEKRLRIRKPLPAGEWSVGECILFGDWQFALARLDAAPSSAQPNFWSFDANNGLVAMTPDWHAVPSFYTPT